MNSRFRKIILAETIIVVAFCLAVCFFAVTNQQGHVQNEVTAFEDRTAAIEGIMTNYLMGEQKICNNWARYINGRDMTMDEAIDFIRISERHDIMAHIVYTDDGTFSGLSTIAPKDSGDNYTVSYAHLDILQNLSGQDFSEDEVNAVKVFTNPVNGIMSFGFYHPLKLVDPDTWRPREAVLLRIVYVSEIEEQWEYMSRKYGNAEIAMIDLEGNYIIKGPSFRGQNFFAAYRTYNSDQQGNEIETVATGQTGSLVMNNAAGEECLVAYMPMEYRDDRILIAFIPYDQLAGSNYQPLLIVLAGGIALYLFNFRMFSKYNKSLQNASANEKQAYRDRKDFLSAIAHDIRNPLNSMIGMAAVAQSKLDDPGVVRESLREIGLSGNYLVTLINDIQDTYDGDNEALKLNPVVFSIADCAEALSHISCSYMREKNIDFNFYINRIEHETLIGDKLRLNQVFANILLNAMQYTPAGGRVDIDLQEEVGRTPDTIQIVYKVSDTGIGIDAEFMDDLYTPFSRGKDAYLYHEDGSGMGLTLTKRILDLMKGRIEVQSRKNSGTTVTVTIELPVDKENVEDMVLPAKHILLVDDKERLRLTAQETLFSLGIVADVAASGTEALEMVQSEHDEGEDYDLVIIDWRMPGMDGFETARGIRHAMGDNVPKMLISAYEWSDMQEDAKAAGVNGFISKPLFRFNLYWKIAETLGIEPKAISESDFFKGMHVLVVEDNNINWGIMEMMLKEYGISCEHANNGKQAVDRMIKSKPGEISVILMDLVMPVMDGLETTRAIRRLPGSAADVPIIAMTAQSFSEDIEACLAAGMNGHIAKPVEKEYVLKELKSIQTQAIANRATFGRHHIRYDGNAAFIGT